MAGRPKLEGEGRFRQGRPGKSGKADEHHDPNAGGSEAAEEASLAFTATQIK